jgi:methylaspartate ammonia-lyase
MVQHLGRHQGIRRCRRRRLRADQDPDLGGVNNTIEAVLYARAKGMGCCLGGSGNETDQSARITAQIGLATRPSFLLSKPGFGGDEALMIQMNEMLRTLALIAARP